uniref:Uncharacterized protein n=1 Tax=Anopheles dirus TaxID=7168 RepID=A0A182NIA3_9DIPT
MSRKMTTVAFVFSFLLASSIAVPVAQNANSGLGAALSSIANSFVVVSEETGHPNVPEVQADEPAVVHLESANALPSLAHIALMPEVQHIKAETQELVYTNETDAQGVVKITIVSAVEEDSSQESTTTERGEDETTTVVGVTTTDADEPTTVVATRASTSSSTPVATTTPTAVLTVLGVGEVDKQKEEEIKENIKEVEAMPVILTVGV